MKIRLLVILIFAVLSDYTFSQFNDIFCLPGAEWHNYEYYNFGRENSWWFDEYVSYTGNYTSGDTVFQVLEMKRIKDGKYQDTSFYEFHIFTENSKTYIVDSDSLRLLYDFNLLAGDTFKLPDAYPDNLIDFIVDSTDSIYVNNIQRKRIIFKNTYYYISVTWVEGIGDINNGLRLFEYAINSNGELYLMCYGENGLNLIGTCPEVSSIDYEVKENSLQVYPNPFSDYLFLDTTDDIYISRIISLTGEVLFENKNGSRMLDTSQLVPGFYILNIQFKNYKTSQFVVKI